MNFVLVAFFLIFFSLNNPVWTSLITCPATTTTSARYSMTLSLPGMASYSGTLLLSSNGNFVVSFTIPETNSPLSAIQGTWSSSSCTNTLTLNGHTFYFLDFPKFSIDNIACTYTCGIDGSTPRACVVTYTLISLKATGTYSLTFDLSTLK
jgi:hypothetical protein